MLALVEGLRLGPFRVQAPVGVGAWSEVWTAQTGPKGQVVALQVLLPTLADIAEQLEAFVEDTSVAARLVHPSIVRVHGLHEENGRVFRSMAWIDGLDLRRLLSRLARSAHRLPADVAVFIAREIVRALMYAGEQRTKNAPNGRTHGHLSPARVMLSRAGKVKVLGFGRPRAFERSAYAPLDESAGLACADRFAVGVMLWEMLTMQRRFAAGDGWPVSDALVVRSVQPLRTIVPALPAGLEAWIEDALSPSSDDPSASLRRMEDGLTEVLSGFAATDPEAAIRALWDELSSEPTPPNDADRTEPTGLPGSQGTAESGDLSISSDPTDPSLGLRPMVRPTIEEPPDEMLRRPWVAVPSSSPTVDVAIPDGASTPGSAVSPANAAVTPAKADAVVTAADSASSATPVTAEPGGLDDVPATDPLRLPTHSEIVRAVENQVTQPVPAPPTADDEARSAVGLPTTTPAAPPSVPVGEPTPTPTPRDEAIVPIFIGGSPESSLDVAFNRVPAGRSDMPRAVPSQGSASRSSSPASGGPPLVMTIVAVLAVVVGLLLVLRTI